MTPNLFMASHHEQRVRNRRNRLEPGEVGLRSAVNASPPGHHGPEPGAWVPAPPATKWRGRTIVLGCLAWYLAVLGLLVLLASSSTRRSPEESAPTDRSEPNALAPPEGPGRHQ